MLGLSHWQNLHRSVGNEIMRVIFGLADETTMITQVMSELACKESEITSDDITRLMSTLAHETSDSTGYESDGSDGSNESAKKTRKHVHRREGATFFPGSSLSHEMWLFYEGKSDVVLVSLGGRGGSCLLTKFLSSPQSLQLYPTPVGPSIIAGFKISR